MLNTLKLEKLLISNWTEFLNHRQLRKYIENNIKEKIESLSISRFEPNTQNGFIVWAELNTSKGSRTVEFNLSLSGESTKFRATEKI